MPTLPRETGWLLIVAYVLGLVMWMTSGLYDGRLVDPSQLLVLFCGVVLVASFVRSLAAKPWSHDAARPSLVVAVVALTIFVIATFVDARLLLDARGGLRVVHFAQIGQVILLASYLPAILRGERESRPLRELRFALFGAALVAGGACVLALSPEPQVDVWRVHTESARALVRGINPYAGGDGIGFVHLPTALYASALAILAHADVRWATLLALLVAGVAIRGVARRDGAAFAARPVVTSASAADATTAKASPNASARARERGPAPLPALAEDAPALMLWLTPKAYLFLEQSWADALPLALLALAVLAHARAQKVLSAISLGAALSAQQSMVWLVPLALLLGYGVRGWIALFGTALLLAAPMVLWDVGAFKHAVVDLYGALPGRSDALTPANWLHHHLGWAPRESAGVLLAALATAFAIWRAPRTRHAFTVAASLAFFAYYAFNRWTFLNYYFFLTGLASLAAAVIVGDRWDERADGA